MFVYADVFMYIRICLSASFHCRNLIACVHARIFLECMCVFVPENEVISLFSVCVWAGYRIIFTCLCTSVCFCCGCGCQC